MVEIVIFLLPSFYRKQWKIWALATKKSSISLGSFRQCSSWAISISFRRLIWTERTDVQSVTITVSFASSMFVASFSSPFNQYVIYLSTLLNVLFAYLCVNYYVISTVKKLQCECCSFRCLLQFSERIFLHDAFKDVYCRTLVVMHSSYRNSQFLWIHPFLRPFHTLIFRSQN